VLVGWCGGGAVVAMFPHTLNQQKNNATRQATTRHIQSKRLRQSKSITHSPAPEEPPAAVEQRGEGQDHGEVRVGAELGEGDAEGLVDPGGGQRAGGHEEDDGPVGFVCLFFVIVWGGGCLWIGSGERGLVLVLGCDMENLLLGFSLMGCPPISWQPYTLLTRPHKHTRHAPDPPEGDGDERLLDRVVGDALGNGRRLGGGLCLFLCCLVVVVVVVVCCVVVDRVGGWVGGMTWPDAPMHETVPPPPHHPVSYPHACHRSRPLVHHNMTQ
jgi:hypothetical protein